MTKTKIGIYLFGALAVIGIVTFLIRNTTISSTLCTAKINTLQIDNMSVKENVNITTKIRCPPYYAQYANLSINLSERP